jgi:hypothetical protein
MRFQKSILPFLRGILPVLVGLGICLALGPASLLASSDEGSDVETALSLGAGYLVSIQGAYTGLISTNSGSAWGIVPDVWEWDIGSGYAYDNTWGATALGLQAASRVLGYQDGMNAVAAYADDLVADFNDMGGFNRSQTIPYRSDLDVLAKMGGPYLTTALDWFQNLPPTGAAEADRIIDGRIAQGNGDLAGFDVSSDIRAALSSGQFDYACALAKRVVERRGDWVGSSPAYISDWWACGSQGALAYSLSLVQAADEDEECDDFSGVIREYRDALIARQSGTDVSPYTGFDAAGGIVGIYAGFPYDSVQFTAFGITGLLGSGLDTTPGDIAAAARAVDYLLRSQYPAGTGPVIQSPAPDPRPADGGWPVYPYFFLGDSNAEINGEALYALALAAQMGVQPGSGTDEDTDEDSDNVCGMRPRVSRIRTERGAGRSSVIGKDPRAGIKTRPPEVTSSIGN